MSKFVGAALGYNDLTVIIAVFESQKVAEEKLVEVGRGMEAVSNMGER